MISPCSLYLHFPLVTMRALWSNSQRKVIIVILEYLKNDDMHTKSGMRSDLNINVKNYRDFYNIFIKKRTTNKTKTHTIALLYYNCHSVEISWFFSPYLTKLITRRKSPIFQSFAVSTPPPPTHTHINIIISTYKTTARLRSYHNSNYYFSSMFTFIPYRLSAFSHYCELFTSEVLIQET